MPVATFRSTCVTSLDRLNSNFTFPPDCSCMRLLITYVHRTVFFNSLYHKYFLRPKCSVAFCEYVFIFWYSHTITNFEFRIFVVMHNTILIRTISVWDGSESNNDVDDDDNASLDSLIVSSLSLPSDSSDSFYFFAKSIEGITCSTFKSIKDHFSSSEKCHCAALKTFFFFFHVETSWSCITGKFSNRFF